MVSSELPEVIGMSDRILVMHDGELVAELPAGSAEHEILGAATGAIDPGAIDPGAIDPGTATDGGAR
jgi:ribose transport system ATP-binding protein